MITVNTMRKLVIILFILLLLLVTPVNAGSSFQYSKVIQTDNIIGYKFVVLDKDVFAHSNQLNDLRVINEKDEEVPYFIASVRDASNETEKISFILSEEAQFISTQEGTDSIITVQAKHLNAFRLELNTDDLKDTKDITYGLFGVKDESTYYLSEGELFNRLSTAPSVNKDIEWTNNPPIDKIKLIIHNRNHEPITPNSITIKYHLNKLVFKDPGNSQLTLAYGNDTLRFPIYGNLNYKEIIGSNIITATGLGAEVENPSNIVNSRTLTKSNIVSRSSILTALVLLVLLGVGCRLWKKNK